MAPIKIYHNPLSPVSRSVVFLAKYLKLEIEVFFKWYFINGNRNISKTLIFFNKVVEVNLAGKEQLEDWYLRLNRQHTVPTLVHDDLVLTESRAMLAYFVNCPKNESSLYPRCRKKRAMIDNRLYFDATTLNVRMGLLGVRIWYFLHCVFLITIKNLNCRKTSFTEARPSLIQQQKKNY